MTRRPPVTDATPSLPRGGWSLIELLVVMCIMGVMVGMAAPRLGRSMEQARADTAAANLRAVWAAQRLYWLEHGAYAPNLPALGALLDPSISSPGVYAYAVESAGASTLRVTATRAPGGQYSGQLAMDEAGTLSGSIQAVGQSAITPGMS